MSAVAKTETIPCAVTLRLADGTRLSGSLRLPVENGGRPSPILDLLESSRDFVPLLLESGEGSLVARHSIETLEIDADAGGAPVLPEADASVDVVTLRLESGATVSGVLRATAPEGYARMSDVFNAGGRFLVLLEGDRLLLVNKRRLVRASF